MKKILFSLLTTLVLIYLFIVALMYFSQRSLLFYPQPSPEQYTEQSVEFNNQGQRLPGWVVNPGKAHALIYFGGNAEQVEQNSSSFYQLLPDYTIYLMPYRGYGSTPGQPTEAGLFSDALYIHDEIKDNYLSISAIGRSLGSGIATYVAANRNIERLVLITPYDSMARVAQGHYPFLPASFLIKDKFESFKRAKDVKAKTLLFIAGTDVVVPPQHAIELSQHFKPDQLSQLIIEQAGHNDIIIYPQYKQTLKSFMSR